MSTEPGKTGNPAVDSVSVQPPRPKHRGVARGFVDFIRDYGIAPLAVGVILANSVNDFVKSLANGIITPLISLITPGTRLEDLQVTIHHSVFQVGAVLSAFLSLLIVALLVYVVARVVLRNETILTKK